MSWAVDYVKSPIFYSFVNKMMLNVNMFSAIMMTGILGEIDSAVIVKENDGLVRCVQVPIR